MSEIDKSETQAKTADELVIENQLLADQVKALEAKVASLEAAATEKKEAKKSGKGVPHALVQIVGNGRRLVKPGMPLAADEAEGLTEGVHFETR